MARTKDELVSAQRFPSKIDAVFYGVSAFAVGLPLALGVMTSPRSHGLPFVGAFLLAALLIVMARTTYYVVDGESLRVQCLVGRWTIPLASITALSPSSNIMSAPALSIDRIKVTHTGGWPGFALVSPKDKAGFIEAIRRAQPRVVMGKPEGRPSLAMWGVSASVIVPLAIVAVVMYASSRPPTVVVTPTEVTVAGTFGATVPMRDITSVTLEDSMPRVIRKHMGSDGLALRGRFELEGIGDGRIYVERSGHPYVLIRTRDSFVYINYSDAARTHALFDELKRARASASDTGTSTILR